MQKRKSLLRYLKRQIGLAFDAAFWVICGGGGDAGGREQWEGSSHCGSFEIPKSDFASLAYPQHMHTKAVDSRIGGQEDSGRTCHVAVVPFAKGHNFKIFPCFLCALALEIFELTLLEN